MAAPALIGRFEGISAKEISDRILLDQVTISRAIYKCTKRGFIREIGAANRSHSLLKDAPILAAFFRAHAGSRQTWKKGSPSLKSAP
jgi:DNA-binding MarR family transcriptional regulator